jgi:hypothetical protein
VAILKALPSFIFSSERETLVRRFVLKLSGWLPILIGMVWVNWSVDPGRFYVGQAFDPSRHQLEAAIVNDCRAGREHRITTTYNERLVIEQVFRDRPTIEVLVLGSSVAKPIHGGLFPGSSFFNASVYGGELEEAVAIYQLALERGRRPKRVILQLQGFGRLLGKRNAGLEAGFNALLIRAKKRLGIAEESSVAALWESMSAEDPAGQFILERGMFHPYDNLISPRYFQLSLRTLFKKWTGVNSTVSVVDEFDRDDQRILYPDGSVQWSPIFLARSPSDVRKQAEERLRTLNISKETSRVRARCELLETFILDASRSGVAMDIVLTPPVPLYFDRVQAEYAKAGKISPITDAEEYIRSFALPHHIRVIGSFDPHKVRTTDEDYVDHCHLRREAFARRFSFAPP